MNHLKDQQGQMAIFIMLILVVALTVGLTVASRTVNNTRLSNNTELSSRAYSAAEAGIEEFLVGGQVNNVSLGSNVTFNVSPAQTQGASDQTYAFPNDFPKDEVAQLWLFDYQSYKDTSNLPTGEDPILYPNNYYYGNRLTIYWGANSTIGETTPALEVSFIYKQGTDFKTKRYAFDPNATRTTGATANGFTALVAGSEVMNAGEQITTNQGVKTYYFKKTIDLNESGTRYLLMRSKLIYNTDLPHPIAVMPVSSFKLPPQGQVIESTGQAGDVVRKIKVYQSYPSLPALFDFVLFNGSTDPLQKN